MTKRLGTVSYDKLCPQVYGSHSCAQSESPEAAARAAVGITGHNRVTESFTVVTVVALRTSDAGLFAMGN